MNVQFLEFRNKESQVNFLYEMQKDSDVRRMSNSPGVPSLEAHGSWCHEMFHRSFHCPIYLIVNKSQYIGMVRLEIPVGQNYGIISIAVVKEFRGRGVGKQAVRFIIEQAQARCVYEVRASVNVWNAASIRLFTQCAFDAHPQKVTMSVHLRDSVMPLSAST